MTDSVSYQQAGARCFPLEFVETKTEIKEREYLTNVEVMHQQVLYLEKS